MRFCAFVLFLTVAGVLAQTPVQKPVAAKKKTVAKTSTVKKGPASAPKGPARTTPSRASTARKKAPVRRTATVYRQAAPTPERYKEIQDALAAKGYLKTPGTGVWDGDSIDALKRYQMDAKEDPSGRITAASLIGLGLGPRTASLPAASKKPADAPTPPPAEIVP